MSLGETIYQLRTGQNLSQGELAERLEVSRQSVSKWETDGAVPELDKLMRLCDVFEVSLDTLTGREVSAAAPVALPPPAASNLTAQRIVGGILLGVSLLGGVLLFLFSDPWVALLFTLPLLLCGILCVTLRRHAGYFCAWALFLCMDLFTMMLTSAAVIPVTTSIRLVFLLGLLFATFRSFRNTPIPVTRKRQVLLWLGWLLWVLFATWVLFTTIQGSIAMQSAADNEGSATTWNYGALIAAHQLFLAPLVPLIFFSVRFWQEKRKIKP